MFYVNVNITLEQRCAFKKKLKAKANDPYIHFDGGNNTVCIDADCRYGLVPRQDRQIENRQPGNLCHKEKFNSNNICDTHFSYDMDKQNTVG